MKLMNNQLSQTLKPLSLVLLLSFSAVNVMAAEPMPESVQEPAAAPAESMQKAAVIDPESAVLNNAPETYSNQNWQSPTTIEFNKLDKSGNGLLLPHEASKGKAFNRKTFKQADTDKDGSIDLNEYIFFKTGKMPETAKPASAAPAVSEPVTETIPDKAMPEKAMPEAAPDVPMTDGNP
jgi:EF hand